MVGSVVAVRATDSFQRFLPSVVGFLVVGLLVVIKLLELGWPASA